MNKKFDEARLRMIIDVFGNHEEGTIGRGYATLAKEVLDLRNVLKKADESFSFGDCESLYDCIEEYNSRWK